MADHVRGSTDPTLPPHPLGVARPPMQGRSGFVDADGVRIHYLRYGDRGPALVLLPGLSCPAVTYESVSVPLAEDFQVVCVDLRGRGLSDAPPPGSYSLPDFAADVKAVIDACGLHRPIVVGHALGARIVPAFDALYPDVAGVQIVVDPPASGPGRTPYPSSWESFAAQLDAAAEGITADDVRRSYPEWDEQAIVLRAAWLDLCAPHAVEESHRNFQLEDFFGYVARGRTPGMFMIGERTHGITAEGLEEIRASSPNLEIVVVPDTGHMVPFENLEAFLTHTRRFVAEAARAGLVDASEVDLAAFRDVV
jgi:N-formylmaleamate deformylase